ncbi:hypothetical protein GCM10011608_47080 [Micromonospora sonchi]|uniref:DUF4878 domain-containing protein n=1 Tax=Micromonospora sonchi TaxID=1763543 RepID=A0A917U5I3_9ACTN|nr:hypothetical protein [Micromonospora sonchi]GGM56812.1 hypothetical protein GCM10011608_47080 [Micromonospora sonchi]
MTAPGPAAPSPHPATGDSESRVPTPPQGPGVVPPFAAPPTEGGRSRLWLGLGAGALAVLICCGGGGSAVVGLLVSGAQAIEEQGRTVSDDYFRALSDGQFGRAYDQLCEDAKRRESRQEFERRTAAEPQISSYKVGQVDINTLTVPVDVTYAGGGQERQQVVLQQDQQTGGMEVCGVN